MPNKVAASMTASIIIDKKEVISSALDAYARAKKEIDGNKLELLIDVSDDQAIKRLKEIQQELSGKDYIIKFKNQGIDETLKSLDELSERLKQTISDITNLSFGTKNKTEAYNQLKEMADVFKKFYGNEEAMQSKAGTDAAYAYYKAYEEALKKGVAQSRLESVTVDVSSDGFYTANRVSSNRIKDFENFKKYGEDITDVSLEIFSLEQRLSKFSDAYSRVKINLGDAPITPEIIKNIEYYVRALEVAEARARDADLFGFTKKDLDDDKDYANMYLGFALEDAILENEKYKSSLKEVRQEKEKTDEAINHFSISTDNNFEFVELKEDMTKSAKSVNELNSELAELQEKTSVETNISSPITDTFQGDAETEEMKKVAAATDEAVQEKKEFATTNESVQDSVDDSKSKLELEANLMKSIAENSEKAANAKKEFVEANKTVSNSAKTSVEDLEQERNVLDDLGKESGKHSIELGLSPIIDSAKKLDDTLDNIEISTDSFNEVLEKLDLTKSKLGEIVRITKQAHANADGKMIESYILKDSVGSTETYGASSNTEKGQMLAYKYISDNTKAINEQRKAEKELQRQQEKSNAEKLKEEENKKIAKQKENYDELNRTIDRYITIRKRIAKGESLSSDKQEVENLKKSIDDLHKTDLLSEEQYKNTKIRLDNLETSVKDIVALTRQSTFDSMQSDIDRYYKRLNNLKIKPSDIDRSSGYTEALNEYEAAIRKLENHLTKLRGVTEEITEKDIKDWEDLTSSVQEASDKIRAFSSAQKGSSVHSREKEIDKLTKYLKENTKISKTARKELERYLDLLKSGDASTNVQEIHTEWTKVAVAEREAGREGKAFFDILGDKTLYGYAAQLAQYYLSLMDFVRYARAVFDNVIEINTAQTELRKVSDATESRLTENFKTSAKAAKDLGATITDVISATADWSRMGYNVDDAEELARISTLYKNVGDGIDIETANNSLISTLQGFQLTADEAEGVIDKFNEVANNFAIDSAGIGEALQRSAASFNAANTDLSKSIALITATNEVVQDPDSVGTLWKTMSARIRGASTELDQLGEETDEYTQSTSKLRDLVMGLTGFDIMLDENTF